MISLKEIKLAIMQKTDNENLSEHEIKLNKQNFIIRYSGTIDVNELLKEANLECLDEENLYEVCDMIYNNLLELCKNKEVDSVGLWLIYENDKIIENAIDISILDNIKTFHNINPIYEFVKMTLDNES
jgi:hypothetical protein